VEAQGRGTLHCHFLVWIGGHLSPQRMRDRMAEDDGFKAHLFAFLESVIKSELPGMTEVVQEQPGVTLAAPERERGVPNPAVVAPPRCAKLDEDEFQYEFEKRVKELVIENHWHRHNETCWKYLKRGEPRDDAHCRMRIDGTTRRVTELDEETQSILLRRLHPRINCHNDVLAFLTQSNNDIKFIGSGEGAKALIYYVTDYITKASLTTHVGLSALRVAIQKNNKKFEGDYSATSDEVSESLFVKCANNILGRMEVSHPQVMSYILRHGDHYTSHKYQRLFLGSFLREVDAYFGQRCAADTALDDKTDVEDEDVESARGEEETIGHDAGQVPDAGMDENLTIQLDANNGIIVNNQIDDYRFRGQQEPFDTCNLYRFVQKFRKVSIRKSGRDQSQPSGDDVPPRNPRNRNPHAPFHPSHPHARTHQLALMTTEHVPVLLGPSIPSPTGDSTVKKEAWCKAMLILFKPWREFADLKAQEELWEAAFDHELFSPDDRKIMDNMMVLNECRDARDTDIAKRGNQALLPRSREYDLAVNETSRLAISLEMEEAAHIISGDTDECQNEVEERSKSQALIKLVSRALAINDATLRDSGGVKEDASSILAIGEQSLSWQEDIRSTMKQLKKRKRTRVETDNGETDGERQPPRHSQRNRRSATKITTLEANARSTSNGHAHLQLRAQEPLVDIIATEFNLQSNPEQLQAFQIIADRIIENGRQLLMYVGGVGGTGKSHLINAIKRLFAELGRAKELILSAPTGAAGVLIDGATIHSLTLLPNKSNVNGEELKRIWNDVTFLILDEISMVSAGLFADISERINIGKGIQLSSGDVPFGGIHVLITGDFGQLRPVGGNSLYSHNLISHVSTHTAASNEGQQEIIGVAIWRQFHDVVLLRKNQRQADDPVYALLLARVRAGECTMHKVSQNGLSDYDLLRKQVLSSMAVSDPSVYTVFQDAPVIVGARVLRDEVNHQRLYQHAHRLEVTVTKYYSSDSLQKEPVPISVRERLWRVSSTTSKDALGILPLFHGMRVMVTENIAIGNRIVNGAEGTIQEVHYRVDEQGHRYAQVCLVLIEGSSVNAIDHNNDIVPIFPVSRSFVYVSPFKERFHISRSQLPLLPAYSYTDYKSQGRTLSHAIVDLESARSLQGTYVMLSRVKTLANLAILRNFKRERIEQRLSEELRDEFMRLETLSAHTMELHIRKAQIKDMHLGMDTLSAGKQITFPIGQVAHVCCCTGGTGNEQ
jgi:PIF1-like helicase